MYYDIIFKRKWDFETSKVESISYESIIQTLNQLRKWIASIDWKLINWFNSLDELKIIEKNYYWKNGNWECYDIMDNWDIFSFDNLPYEANWREEYEDITNKIFLEIELIWENIYSNSIIYTDWVITIRWKDFTFDKKTKIYEIIDLYFKAKNYFWTDELKYEQLEEIFKNQNYIELKNKDLNYDTFRWLLKNRMKKISDDLWIENLLDIKTNYIKISL